MHANHISLLFKAFGYLMVSCVFLYLLNNYLVYWQDMPGTGAFFAHYGWLGAEVTELNEDQLSLGWRQFSVYLVVLVLTLVYVWMTRERSLEADSVKIGAISAYIVRFAFWGVLLVGLADMFISFLRVEGFLDSVFGEDLGRDLGRSIYRGTYVHYPLLFVSLLAAWHFKKVSFTWLALMIVFSEFLIVITRFVFSYEQAYMGDVVRFWYAGLFLFGSAYALVSEGHVRVDVIYAGFSRRKKAWFDSAGSTLLGMPICWIILTFGMGGRGNTINSPLLSFEVSQSGYGMYVKYLMAGYLVIFAVTMLIQFVSYLLYNVSLLLDRGSLDDRSTYQELLVDEAG